MYAAVDRVLDYVISRGIPFILLLIVLYLIYRYFVYGQGNKTLICPSIFGTTYNNKCLNNLGYVVDMKGELIKKENL